jgi:hypothetical protein
MPKLVTITGVSSRLEITRHRTVRLVEAGILPGPIEGTRLYHWPTVLKCLDNAGMGQLVKPECRA